MNKPILKVLDDKGGLLLSQPLRASLGIEKGVVVAITADKGKIMVKKAVVMADDNMPIEAKECYVQAVVREFDSKVFRFSTSSNRTTCASGGNGLTPQNRP